MNRHATRLLLCILALCFLFSACSAAPAPTVPTPDPQQDTVPNNEAVPGVLSSFATDDLYGNEVDQSLLNGASLTMISVWTTFCGYCIQEMPDLNALHNEYADRGFQVVGMVVDVLNSDGTDSESQLELAREIVEKTGAAYPHLTPSPDLYHIMAQIKSFPTTFFVDSTGKQVGTAYMGALDKDIWIAIIEDLLGEVDA